MDHTLILHNIRSVHNVGSMFRTADAAGVSRIILSGYTPTPLDQYGRARADFAKVSLGAEKTVSWKYVKTPNRSLKHLRSSGHILVAVEQDKRSKSLFEWTPPSHAPLAILVGNEIRGLSKSIRDSSDVILEISMRGKKESLNVSVTAGIVLFTLLKR